jgi:hypothetical protein
LRAAPEVDSNGAMNDDDFLQDVDEYSDEGYFPQLQPQKDQAERLEREGLLEGFMKHIPGYPSVKLYRLTPQGKLRVPRYRPHNL